MAAKSKPKPGATPPAAEFDEASPPPRRRVVGDPAPVFAALPPGAKAADQFAEWDAAGRFPAGSVLTRFVGVYRPGGSGYEVVAGVGLGKPGTKVALDAIDDWRSVSVLVEDRRYSTGCFVVLAPPEGE